MDERLPKYELEKIFGYSAVNSPAYTDMIQIIGNDIFINKEGFVFEAKDVYEEVILDSEMDESTTPAKKILIPKTIKASCKKSKEVYDEWKSRYVRFNTPQIPHKSRTCQTMIIC